GGASGGGGGGAGGGGAGSAGVAGAAVAVSGGGVGGACGSFCAAAFPFQTRAVEITSNPISMNFEGRFVCMDPVLLVGRACDQSRGQDASHAWITGLGCGARISGNRALARLSCRPWGRGEGREPAAFSGRGVVYPRRVTRAKYPRCEFSATAAQCDGKCL